MSKSSGVSSRRKKHSSGLCPQVSEGYEKLGRLGHGTYGVVYKARCRRKKDTIVALKRCLKHHESTDGFPITALREIHALRVGQSHPNVTQLLDVAVSEHNVFLVLEYAHQDVGCILDKHYQKYQQSPFAESHVKRLFKQLLSALAHLHSHFVMHRDIKMSNLLYNNRDLKLADFGLARRFSTQQRNLTQNVVSLWYRPPELLFAADGDLVLYTESIDMWAAGLIMGELLQGSPLLEAKNVEEQCAQVQACLGPPPPIHGSHKNAPSVPDQTRAGAWLWDRFDYLGVPGLELLTQLIHYEPQERWTASQSLASPYFAQDPLPTEGNKMPHFAVG